MKAGYLYIITNPAHIGFLKIGITEDIKNRLQTYQTGDPKRSYKIEFYLYHPDCLTAEKRIKKNMHYFAKSIKNEWYEIDLSIAISRLQEQLDDYNNNEFK
jgi:predicted GIY-YIG superfamily endonuclease